MTDKKIVIYIKENLLKGHKVQAIKDKLLEHNHKESEINKAISKVNQDYEKNLIHP